MIEEMQAWVNRWLVDSAVAMVDENRQSIASLISDTVRSWDAAKPASGSSRRLGAISSSFVLTVRWWVAWWAW